MHARAVAAVVLLFAAGCALPWNRFQEPDAIATADGAPPDVDAGDDLAARDGIGTDVPSDDAAVDGDAPPGVDGGSGLGPVVHVVAGDAFTCALDTTGAVWCWGANLYGQLGNATVPRSAQPMRVALPAAETVASIASGRYGACALMMSGVAYCWGRNLSGELGIGSFAAVAGPVRVLLPDRAISIGLGDSFACATALPATGTPTTYCWGANSSGQTGTDTDPAHDISMPTPVARAGLGRVTCGTLHACARDAADNSIWCWGRDELGQLGDTQAATHLCNGLRCSLVPVQAIGATGTPRAGTNVTCALDTTPSVTKCWGANGNSQISSLAQSTFTTPTAVAFGVGASQVAIGMASVCTLAGAQVLCHGSGSYGQLANGTFLSSATEFTVPLSVAAAEVASGWTHTCAVLTDHTLWCWGSNTEAQLGNQRVVQHAAAVQVFDAMPAPVAATSIGAGLLHACAVVGSGAVVCWGAGDTFQTGTARTSGAELDVAHNTGVSGGATDLALGDAFTCARNGASGSVQCWGDNSSNQLAVSLATSSTLVPQTVPLAGGVTAIAAGGRFACALAAGVPNCWGDNTSGQLGRGTAGGASSMPQVVAARASGAVAAGGAHACAMNTAVGGPQCWGDNVADDVWATAPSPATTPVDATLANVTALELGYQTNCAIVASPAPQIQCWGRNDRGQVGNGTTTTAPGPVPVALPGGVTPLAISVGQYHACAIGNDHRVYCWGANDSAQLGLVLAGGATMATVPTLAAPAIVDAIDVAAGGYFTCVQRMGHSVWCWGDDRFGQLGHGSRPLESTPVQAFP